MTPEQRPNIYVHRSEIKHFGWNKHNHIFLINTQKRRSITEKKKREKKNAHIYRYFDKALLKKLQYVFLYI